MTKKAFLGHLGYSSVSISRHIRHWMSKTKKCKNFRWRDDLWPFSFATLFLRYLLPAPCCETVQKDLSLFSHYENPKKLQIWKKKRKKIISGGGKTDYIHTKCVLPKMFHTILCSPPDRSTADEHSKFCTDRKSFQKRKGVRFSKGRWRAFQSLGKKQFLLSIWRESVQRDNR